MLNRALSAFVVIVALGTAQANAASLTLVPSSSSIARNGTLTVTMVLNALDVSAQDPKRFGGEVVIDFDPLLLTYDNDYAPLNASTLYTGPTVGTAGSHKTLTLGFDHTGASAVVGSFTLKVVGNPGAVAQIGLADADQFFGTFVSYNSTNHAFYPAFTGTSVTVAAVPLPGAAWLFLTGAGLVGLRAGRKDGQGLNQNTGKET